jgi:6-phosphogluconolactonase
MNTSNPLFRKVYHYADNAALAAAVAARFRDSIHLLLQEKALVNLALSGGQTPLALYQELSKKQYERTIDWQALRFYFGDERLVPVNDSESNFYQAQSFLFSHKNIPATQIFPMQPYPEVPDTSTLIKRYHDLLKDLPRNNANLPVFDLILLGIGQDGHIASLFPGQTACQSWVCATEAPQAPTARLTLSAPVLAAAKQLLLLAGSEKKAIVEKIAANRRLTPTYPDYPVDVLTGAAALEWHLAWPAIS